MPKKECSLKLCQYSCTIPENFGEHWWNTYSTPETGCHCGIFGNGICRCHLGNGELSNKHVNHAYIWVRTCDPGIANIVMRFLQVYKYVKTKN